MIRSSASKVAILAGLAFIILACGKKMPPRPPTEVAPRAVRELSARLTTEKAIVLTWKAPTKRKDGSPLTRLSGFRVLKGSYKFTEDCPGCPARFTDTFNVMPPGIKKEKAGESAVQFTDNDIAYGHKYVYTVQAIDDDGRVGEPAGSVSVYWDLPPGPPAALNAQAGDGRVMLTWKAPEKLSDGSAVDESFSYYLYRRKGDSPYERLIEAGLLSKPAFTDTSVVNDTSYAYKVRAVRSVKDTLIEGAESQEVIATPQDKTPPAPPSGLSATLSPQGVDLKWLDNTEPDLGGYRVYRRAKEESTWQRLSQEPKDVVRYTDKDVRKGKVYYYTLTAIDSSPRQNESMMSFEVKVLFE